MNPLLETVLTIAILVEIITNFVKKLIPSLDKQYITVIAGAIGIFLSWVTQTGIFSSLQIHVALHEIDYILTGIIVSRGANIVHDLAKRLNF
ncbi:MAG: hypothetical protein GX020_02675 [Firmicutes bacterium]|nr:hypothetical protein [Bacillota bacterium]